MNEAQSPPSGTFTVKFKIVICCGKGLFMMIKSVMAAQRREDVFSSGDQGSIHGADESQRRLQGVGVGCEVCSDVPVRV